MNSSLAIVFDLGGVLFDWNPKYLYRKIFSNKTKMDYFLTHICSQEWNEQMDAGKPFADAIAEQSALTPQYAPYIAAYFDRWDEMIGGAISDTVEILAELKAGGAYLCALSNWSAETYPKVQANYPFLGWFEQVVLSGEEKVIKPNPKIYQILLQRIKRAAEDCLFIDDSAPNITAAKKLGFQTIHFHNPAQTARELQQMGLLYGQNP